MRLDDLMTHTHKHVRSNHIRAYIQCDTERFASRLAAVKVSALVLCGRRVVVDVAVVGASGGVCTRLGCLRDCLVFCVHRRATDGKTQTTVGKS